MKNYINQKGFIFFSLTLYLFATTSCGIYKKVDTRKVPINAQERAKKNVSEGRGISIGSIRKGGGGSTTYQFSTSNSMWRASLDVLDFLPLSNVDYSIVFESDLSLFLLSSFFSVLIWMSSP